jgi:hypothetical protein
MTRTKQTARKARPGERPNIVVDTWLEEAPNDPESPPAQNENDEEQLRGSSVSPSLEVEANASESGRGSCSPKGRSPSSPSSSSEEEKASESGRGSCSPKGQSPSSPSSSSEEVESNQPSDKSDSSSQEEEEVKQEHPSPRIRATTPIDVPKNLMPIHRALPVPVLGERWKKEVKRQKKLGSSGFFQGDAQQRLFGMYLQWVTDKCPHPNRKRKRSR